MNPVSSVGLALTVVLLLTAVWMLRRASVTERGRAADAGADGGAPLDDADRRTVRAAVRAGTRCEDPRLARAAAVFAQRDLVGLHSPWARTGWLLIALSQACNAAWIGLRLDGPARWACLALVVVLLVAGLAWWGWWAPFRSHQARRALALNRHVGQAGSSEETADA